MTSQINIAILLPQAISRSSHRSCSVKNKVLRNFAEFTGKHLSQSLFFNKVAGLRPATLSKKRLWHMCLPSNFVKFLRTPFLQNTSRRLLLHVFFGKEPYLVILWIFFIWNFKWKFLKYKFAVSKEIEFTSYVILNVVFQCLYTYDQQ